MSVELPPLPPAHPLDQHWHNGQWQSFGYTADQMRAYAAEALKARKWVTDDLLAALELTLDAIGALRKPYELYGHGLDEQQIESIFAAIARADVIREQS